MPYQYVGPRHLSGFECGMQVFRHIGHDLRFRRWIAETVAGPVEGTYALPFRDLGLSFVPDDGPAREPGHQNDRRGAGARALEIDAPAADIYQLAWLGIRQRPQVFHNGGRWSGLGKDDFTSGKQQGDR